VLKKLNVHKYKGLSEVTIEFDRITMLSGYNNVGKTTLLEALFLLLGANNPSLTAIINAVRGYTSVAEPIQVWGWLFPQRDITDRISINSLDSKGVDRDLEIRLGLPGELTLDLPDSSKVNNKQRLASSDSVLQGSKQLLYHYTERKGRSVLRDFTTSAAFTQKGLALKDIEEGTYVMSLYVSTALHTDEDDVKRYSKLEEDGRHADVLDALKLIEPRLKSITVGFTGDTPIIRCDIGLPHLMPITILGSGMCRLFDIVVGILTCPGGMTLIDEIDAGLSYSVLKEVWRHVIDVAERHNVQIVATTHSYEGLRALHMASSERIRYCSKLYRLERIDSTVKTILIDQASADYAFERGLELR
jgi:hypothetical protein